MAAKSQRPKGQEGTVFLLNAAIEAMNLAEKASSITPATAVFGTVGTILTMIKGSMVNELDYVELGLFCADICRALDRGMNGKKLDDLGQSVCDAMTQLTMTVAEIQKKIIRRSGRNAVSRIVYARDNTETIAAWKSELNRILVVFNTELVMNTHTIVADIHQNMFKICEDVDRKNRANQNSFLGESPPPPSKVFGRDRLIEKIVHFAERLTPIALIGAGGIGKTSTALTVLHDDRIKRRFGEDRRFIRCDKFPPSLPHFLRQLSKTIGASIENPKDLTQLRPFLSTKEMFIVLDNAESVLDPHVTSAQEIYAVVEELGHLSNICVCITSRISTFPPSFKWLDIPTLSREAARDTFYRIYKHDRRSRRINNILEQLDFHALSITLLATVAHHNKWDIDRLTREWDEHRTDMLQTDHKKSLAATIELSLSSSTFRELGPNARDLLGVIAFFPQGVDENHVDWLFPTIDGRKKILDKFCVLSLTYRNDGFITMLAPIRDHLSPKDPMSAHLLCSTKERYFSRLSIYVKPDRPGFEEAIWITSEDVNVEHLLDVFTTIDVTSADVWDVCAGFMGHLNWHKPRLTMLGPKIEALPNDHPSKPECLFQLSRLLGKVGNHTERKRLLTRALKLSRERGEDHRLVLILRELSEANRMVHRFEKGIRRAKEASGLAERLGDVVTQAECLVNLAWLLHPTNQLDAAEAASRAINLLSQKGENFLVCKCHYVLGLICRSKHETEKAIQHLEMALRLVSSPSWLNLLFWIQYWIAVLLSDQGRLDDAHAHVVQAKSHAVNGNDRYLLAHAMWLQAGFWYRQRRFEEAKSEASCAIDAFEGFGSTNEVNNVREILRQIRHDARRNRRSDYRQ